MNNTTEQLDPQEQLAEHIQAMHKELTKLCMERWSQLARGAFDPAKIENIKAVLQSIGSRLVYAQNCCWIIEYGTNTTNSTEANRPGDHPSQSEIN